VFDWFPQLRHHHAKAHLWCTILHYSTSCTSEYRGGTHHQLYEELSQLWWLLTWVHEDNQVTSTPVPMLYQLVLFCLGLLSIVLQSTKCLRKCLVKIQ
jgi:hypothetical protein